MKSQSPDGDFFDPAQFALKNLSAHGTLSQSPDGDFFDPAFVMSFAENTPLEKSQSPDGDFFDPARCAGKGKIVVMSMSQSPDGDFFDPAVYLFATNVLTTVGHSPLTGIFLIRRITTVDDLRDLFISHSPLTGIFLIRRWSETVRAAEESAEVTVP